MATALKLITRAFSKAGIRPAESPLSDSEVEDGLDVLNDLFSSLNADGTLKGVDLVSDVNDEVTAPRESHWMLKAKMAIILAGEYGIQVTQAMAADATQAMESWLASSVDLRFLKLPGTLPIGSGNQDEWGLGWDRDFYPQDERDNF